MTTVSRRELEASFRLYAFHSVTNADIILKHLQTGNNTGFAAVDLSMVISEFHLQCAIMKSLLGREQNSMVTNSISVEIIYQLASTTKINEAIRQFSVKSDSKEISIIAFLTSDGSECTVADSNSVKAATNSGDGTKANALSSVLAELQGVPISDLSVLSTPDYLTKEKTDRIQKAFRITPQELLVSTLEDAVVSRIATKDML